MMEGHFPIPLERCNYVIVHAIGHDVIALINNEGKSYVLSANSYSAQGITSKDCLHVKNGIATLMRADGVVMPLRHATAIEESLSQQAANSNSKMETRILTSAGLCPPGARHHVPIPTGFTPRVSYWSNSSYSPYTIQDDDYA